jgi:hypothetical protein
VRAYAQVPPSAGARSAISFALLITGIGARFVIPAVDLKGVSRGDTGVLRQTLHRRRIRVVADAVNRAGVCPVRGVGRKRMLNYPVLQLDSDRRGERT